MLKFNSSKSTHVSLLFNNILILCRKRLFYTKFDLIDTFQNRINLIFVHISFIFIKIKQDNKQKKFQQKFFDLVFEKIELNIWHSFAAESKEQATFESKISLFMSSNPGVEVQISAVPYPEADQQFMIAAQGGEAPDLVRLSSDQLGKIGDIRVGGQPLLEDQNLSSYYPNPLSDKNLCARNPRSRSSTT